ncbi:NAD(P)H-binding protein [Streptomyces sp. SID3343]|uniref:NmrA family NAD(P)-binding protein n=1 Tax=Streptomyces sp. SID3343 TaxID=2690260 RepID=UPI00136B3D86|nr:NAD(P)H-binding protein [Streptomyces sp. SID3343]MYV96775.1 NmrA family NAD(P)-binding protein [Streptomyces sp. SID3343]
MPRTVLITGATGTVSTALMDALEGAEVNLRALVRDDSKADGLRARGAEVFVGDLDEPGTLP